MSASAATLVLRDVQLPPQPAWWPPAPGWWLLAAALLLLLAALLAWQWRRWRRAWHWGRHFDQALAGIDAPVERVRRASELLRRAALARQPALASCDGQAWRQWLQDGSAAADAAVRVLAEGGFRPELAAAEAEAACALARRRFIATMGAR